MQKIRQRFSLAHSTHIMSSPLKSKQISKEHEQKLNNQQSHDIDNIHQQKPKHRKKKSLGEAIFKHLPQKLLHHDHDNEDHYKPKKKKSLSFSAGNKKLNITPLNDKPSKKTRFRKSSNGSNDGHIIFNKQRSLNRANSIGNNGQFGQLRGIPQAEEHEADYGLDDNDYVHDHTIYDNEHDPYFSVSSSSPRAIPPSSPLPKLKKSLSSNSIGSNYPNININNNNNNNNNIHNGHLPPPQSPRKDLEHEKNTLIEQMRQLQKSMMQLGEMLSDQDNKLAIEKKKNENLTEQVNNLADENMELRAQIRKHRDDRNKIWHDLEFYKLSTRQCKEKNIILGNQIVVVNQQKATLLDHTQKLNEQLTNEKDKSRKLTLKIRKYSKNVKSLHKKTHSLSGLAKYHNFKNIKIKKPRTPSLSLSPSSDPGSSSILTSPTTRITTTISTPPILTLPSSLDIVNEPETKSEVDQVTQNHLQKKQAEILELEKQTLELLNQLRKETLELVGDSKGMSKRLKHGHHHHHSPKSKSKLKSKSKSKSKTKNKRKGKNRKKTKKQETLHDDIEQIYVSETSETEISTVTNKKVVKEIKKKGDSVVEIISETISETKNTKTKTTIPQRKNGGNKSQQNKEVHWAPNDETAIHEKEGNNTHNTHNTRNTLDVSGKSSSTSSDETESPESSSTEEGGYDIHQVLGKIAKRPSIDHNGDIDDIEKLRNNIDLEDIKEEPFEEEFQDIDIDEYPQSETPMLSTDDEDNNNNNIMIQQQQQQSPQQLDNDKKEIVSIPATIESEDEIEEYDQTDDDEDEDDDNKRASIINQKKEHLDTIKKAGAGVGLQLDAFAALMDLEGMTDSENEEPEPKDNDKPLSFIPPDLNDNDNDDNDDGMTLDDLW